MGDEAAETAESEEVRMRARVDQLSDKLHAQATGQRRMDSAPEELETGRWGELLKFARRRAPFEEVRDWVEEMYGDQIDEPTYEVYIRAAEGRNTVESETERKLFRSAGQFGQRRLLILALAAEGKTNAEIAKALKCSVRMVREMVGGDGVGRFRAKGY